MVLLFSLHRCPKKFISPFCLARPEIIVLKVLTDNQTEWQILWHGYVWFFSWWNLLPPYLLRLHGITICLPWQYFDANSWSLWSISMVPLADVKYFSSSFRHFRKIWAFSRSYKKYWIWICSILNLVLRVAAKRTPSYLISLIFINPICKTLK